MEWSHTWVGNANSDVAAIEALSIEFKGLLQAIGSSELSISETLGAHLSAILNNTNADNFAAGEEIGHGFRGRIVGQVAKVSSVRRLVGNSLREFGAFLASVACRGC